MNTITTTASANHSILAIDLGKYKSVACVHDQETGEFRFTTFDTTRAELQKLISRDRPDVVIIKACLLAGWVHDLCVELGVRCLVADGDVAADRGAAMAFADRLSADVGGPTHRGAESHSRLFVAQGLPAPRGARAWTATGLAGIAAEAKALAECGPDELWRGLLELALTEYRQVCELIAQAEARLDALGKQSAGGDLAGDGAGNRAAHGRDRGGLSERCGPVQDRQAGVGLQRHGATPASVRRDGSAWPNHQAWPRAAQEDAGRMRLVHAALQRLGARHLPTPDWRRSASQEAGDRRSGTQDLGAMLGDVA